MDGYNDSSDLIYGYAAAASVSENHIVACFNSKHKWKTIQHLGNSPKIAYARKHWLDLFQYFRTNVLKVPDLSVPPLGEHV